MSMANRAIEAIDELAEYRKTTIAAMASLLARCQTLADQNKAMLEACQAAVQFGIVGPGALVLVEQLRNAIAQATGAKEQP